MCSNGVVDRVLDLGGGKSRSKFVLSHEVHCGIHEQTSVYLATIAHRILMGLKAGQFNIPCPEKIGT